jgi:hypothetical protein
MRQSEHAILRTLVKHCDKIVLLVRVLFVRTFCFRLMVFRKVATHFLTHNTSFDGHWIILAGEPIKKKRSEYCLRERIAILF